MDQNDLQTEENKPALSSDESVPNANSSNRVFDISDDNISPISVEDLAKEPAPDRPIPPPVSLGSETNETDKRATPPPEENLLDQKIGSFDATPFAAPASAPVSAPPAPKPAFQAGPILVKSQAQIPIQKTGIPSVTPAAKGRSLQEEIAAALPANLRPKTDTPARQEAAPPVDPSPAPQPNPPLPQSSSREVIKPVRTYEGDVAEAMSHKRTSTASIAIAESKKNDSTERISDDAPKNTGKKMLMLLISLILLLGGAYGAFYLYSKSALAPVVPVEQQRQAAPSIIPSSSQAIVVIDPRSPILARRQIGAEIAKNQTPDSIKEIVPATKGADGSLVRVSATDMITAMEISVPDILARSLTPNWMLGVYNDQSNAKSVFVVGTTNFFQNTFAGMLQWERVMADDLRQFIFPENIEGVSNEPKRPTTGQNPLLGIDSILPLATTSTSSTTTTAGSGKVATGTAAVTATTTDVAAPLRQYATIRGKFEDRIVKNKDVRAFRDDSGTIIFLYSFIDSAHLVITDKESTLAEILSRLEKQTFIR